LRRSRDPTTHVDIAERFALPPGAANRWDGPNRADRRFTEMGRGRIVWCADARVMATNVLGVEMLVQHRSQQDAPDLLHVPLRAMDQLMRRDDARVARVDPHQLYGNERVDAPEAVHRDQVHQQGNVDELQGRENVQH
jgi:hypothetical protein